MTIEEIKKNAPDGATHYMLVKHVHVADQIVYFKESNNCLEVHSSYIGWVWDRRTRISELKPLN